MNTEEFRVALKDFLRGRDSGKHWGPQARAESEARKAASSALPWALGRQDQDVQARLTEEAQLRAAGIPDYYPILTKRDSNFSVHCHFARGRVELDEIRHARGVMSARSGQRALLAWGDFVGRVCWLAGADRPRGQSLLMQDSPPQKLTVRKHGYFWVELEPEAKPFGAGYPILFFTDKLKDLK